MLTGMTDEDWEITLEAFDAAQSGRGEPGLVRIDHLNDRRGRCRVAAEHPGQRLHDDLIHPRVQQDQHQCADPPTSDGATTLPSGSADLEAGLHLRCPGRFRLCCG